MGQSGQFLIMILVLMAITSTGSAEVIAVTSILVYDVYRLHLKVGTLHSWRKTFRRTVVGSIVWEFRRLKNPRCREMSARGYALHSVCPQLSYFLSLHDVVKLTQNVH